MNQGTRTTETLMPNRYQRDAERALENAVRTGSDPRADVGLVAKSVTVIVDERERKARAVVQMLEGDPRGYPTPFCAWADITGRPLSEADPFTMMKAIVGTQRGQESVTFPTSFANVFSDALSRRLIAEYQGSPAYTAWRLLVSDWAFQSDFRTRHYERIGGYGVLPTVNQSAPYQPLTSPTNDGESTMAVTKKGGTEDLTFEAIAADDVGVYRRIITLLSRAAANTLARATFDILINNANTGYDSTALFHASHANLNALALSAPNLATVRAKMRRQTAYGDASDAFGPAPAVLFHAVELEDTAQSVCAQVNRPSVWDEAGSGVGVAIKPITVPYWSSVTRWYLVADPATVPLFAAAFAAPSSDPSLTVQNEPTAGSVFTNDKLTIKLAHAWAVGVVEHRGLQLGNT